MTKQEAELILSNPSSDESKVKEAKLTLENLGAVLETVNEEVKETEEGEENV